MRCELWYQYHGYRFHKMRRLVRVLAFPPKVERQAMSKESVPVCPSKESLSRLVE